MRKVINEYIEKYKKEKNLKKGGNFMYTIDTKKDDKYFIIKNNNTGSEFKISKSCNTLDAFKKLIGLVNIKEII